MAARYLSMVVAEQVERNHAVRCRIANGHKIRRLVGFVPELDKALLVPDPKIHFVAMSINKYDDGPLTVAAHRNGVKEVVEFLGRR